MNTVRASACTSVRYATPEMKLFAWLCMAWRPPVSSTLPHISLSAHGSFSPKSNAPNSTSKGVRRVAASTSSGVSTGRSIVVWLS